MTEPSCAERASVLARALGSLGSWNFETKKKKRKKKVRQDEPNKVTLTTKLRTVGPMLGLLIIKESLVSSGSDKYVYVVLKYIYLEKISMHYIF